MLNTFLLAFSILQLVIYVANAQVDSTPSADSFNRTTSTGIECYQCYGVMGGVTNCGATLYPEDPINITMCAHSCAKIKIYMIDQKMAIARDCVANCQNGCVKQISSQCYHCCNTTLCNGAAGHGYGHEICKRCAAQMVLTVVTMMLFL